VEPIITQYRGNQIIRDFWEHYTEFPELYDRFALTSVRAVEQLDAIFGFGGHRVLNIASGTGKDTFEIARRAKRVIGLELSSTMLSFAVSRQRQLRTDNVDFVAGVAEALPFRDATFGRALSIHGAPFVGFGWEEVSARECLRVVEPGGWAAFVSAPDPSDLSPFLLPLGFEFREVDVELDYGSLDEALATWGCIRGEEAIDHLLDENTSTIRDGIGIWFRRLDQP
jgi:ubiquinone/menaquinone biosynthesis C-methylase UbiE